MRVAHKMRDVVAVLTAPDGELPVTEREIGGITYPIFTSIRVSLPAMFQVCLEHGAADFVISGSYRRSFRDVYGDATRVANLLVARGVKSGDRVAIAMRNRPEWIAAYMGTLMSGAVVVPMNSWWTGPELAFGLEDSGAVLAFVDQRRADALLKAGCDIATINAGRFGDIDHEMASLLGDHSSTDPPAIVIDAEDLASIMYTSGSTGQPKGAVSTHRAILSALYGWGVLGISLQIVEGTIDQEPEHQLGIIATVPFFHVTGCYAQFMMSILLGRKLVIQHHWEAEEAADLIEKERLSNFVGVPTMTYELMMVAKRKQHDLSSLTDINAGGAPQPPDRVAPLAEAFEGAWPSAGYGLTETNALTTVITRDDYLEKPASVGLPTPPVMQVEIRDDDGNAVAGGERGEICVKCASNIREYWNRPQESAETITNGWVRTGDLGYLDDEGFLYIVDRLKNIIVRGGENVGCAEVEAALSSHAAIREAIAFAVPDERLGETVGVTITSNDSGLAPADLRKWLHGKLAPFKIPDHWRVVDDSLPRLASGKIDRISSRRMLLDELGISDTDT